MIEMDARIHSLRRRGAHLRSPWPDRPQALLLRAALAQNGQAIEAWHGFTQLVDLDQIDRGSQRLLPLTYRNLLRQGVEGEQLRSLKNIYKHAWYRSHDQLRGGAQALQALHEGGLQTMVLKGAVLGACYYQDPGSRPMDDFDVMVPFESARHAIEVLRSAGWTPHDREPEAAFLRHHAEPFHGPGGRELDLHWHLQWEEVDDAAIWSAALPFTIAGVVSKRLCPADQLLHVCVHGSSSDPVAPIRWIADAVLIARQQGDGFDWSRLIEQASARRLTVTIAVALSYLRDSFAIPVPEAVMQSLRERPTSRSERWAHRARVTPGLPGRKLPIVWERYSKLAAINSTERGFAALVRFLQQLWGLERRRELPIELVRRTLRHGFSSDR